MSTSLFSKFSMRDLNLANRIVVSPMCQYSAIDGRATDWHTIHWGQLLQSGAGMFTIEATAVSAPGRITFGCLGLYDDACEQALGEGLAIARANAPSMPVAIQLAHSGRKGSSRVPWEGGQLIQVDQGGWIPVAPSAIAQLEHEHRRRRSTRRHLHTSSASLSMPRVVRCASESARSNCTWR